MAKSHLPNVTETEIHFWERTFIVALNRVMAIGEVSGDDATDEAAHFADQAVIRRRLRLAKSLRLAKRRLQKGLHRSPV